MWAEVAKIAGAGLVALVVSLIGLRVQLGARRRRVRRDLYEELELMRVLKEQSRDPQMLERVEERVADLESDYHWQLLIGPGTKSDALFLARFPILGAVGVALAEWAIDFGWDWWVAALAGVAGGVLFVLGVFATIAIGDWIEDRLHNAADELHVE